MRSIKELSAEANSYPFSPGVSFPSWIHVCQTLQREARVYDGENDARGIERAYILYLRLADLVLNRLPRHPSFSAYKSQYGRVYNEIPRAIARSEALKKRLEARAPEPVVSPAKPAVQAAAGTSGTTDSSVASAAAPAQHLADEGEYDTLENTGFESAQISLDDSLRATLQSLKSPYRSSLSPARSPPPLTAKHEYPSITAQNGHAQPPPAPVFAHDMAFSPPQSRPSPPPKPKDAPLSTAQHKSVYSTERGEQLRPVYVPADLRARFLAYAVKNTRANLETCGILCGKLNRNAFFVTNLVVPHQTSTSDSCDMTNEEELFEYADKRDLFIVGWIHTHPSQSCFMSSIDLHTQAGYQIMLPEAIAIVCAPSAEPSWGTFRLTDPPGVDTIKNCRLTGFHPHAQPNLYKLANPGHVKEIPFSFEDVDLRDS